MKLARGLALSSLYSIACAAATGHVFIQDSAPRPASQASSSVDPETARLILAQRLGLSRFHSIKTPSEETIQQINAFSGRQQKLFGGEDAEATQAQLLVWVEDVEDVKDLIRVSSLWQSSFTISTPPSASDNDRLINDMIMQADSLPKKADPKGNTYAGINAIDALVAEPKLSVHNEYLSIIRKDGKKDDELADMLENLRTKSVLGQAYSITVVVMPPSSSHSKRAAKPWGSYDLPSKLEARREPTEAPLTPATTKPATSSNPVVSDLEDFPVITQAQSNDTSTVYGILPACFVSQSECEKSTHGCSGHGSCRVSRKGGEGRKDCYSCACTPTVQHTGEKGMESQIKTTYWGGPACQKKDVSVPFWLFVGTGVMLAFLITTGIGMLYSMGSEELPSVIGAGVSGPVRK